VAQNFQNNASQITTLGDGQVQMELELTALMTELQNIQPIEHANDKVVWIRKATSVFTTSSAYNFIIATPLIDSNCHVI
jgi:hypothetical protein